jgi:hypothetical protein
MSSHLKLSFRRMGAELDITEPQTRRAPLFAIDVRDTKEGERFELTGRMINKEDIKILDIEPENRHLLLMWYERETGTKHKYLCGHDERHWFVAAIPDTRQSGVKNVEEAMEALKPEAVRDREQKVGLKGKAKRERWNPAWKRQGEWFFVPVWNRISLKKAPILKNEPIQRGRAKPHMCEFLVRDGGERVMVCDEYPNGLTMKAYEKLIRKDQGKARLRWRPMVRDAKVFAMGRISHPDHATINLGRDWHEVLMNRENEAPSMKHLRFLD